MACAIDTWLKDGTTTITIMKSHHARDSSGGKLTFHTTSFVHFAAVGLIWDLKGVPEHILHSKDKEHAKELRKQMERDRPPVARGEVTKPVSEDVEDY